ncbi:response regulator [Paenibacillus sp. IB182496]|uniref:Response regulator n=1 Tax=Paenibacillus sabuli TaxID=2772509 RepID=A0A927BP63_9BACL|nr:response regulator [Paenibacillus sabuli]MBD2844168.1 response regulator [Paenibacillus sabuli]
MRRCRVLIADDERKIREGMKTLIARNAPEWEVVGEARTGCEALEQLEEAAPDLVMTDIRMPQMDGIALTKELHLRAPDVAVVILTGYKDFEYAQAVIPYGVLDFLLKPCPEEQVVRVLEQAREAIRRRQAERERSRKGMRQLELMTVRSLMLRLPYEAASLPGVREHYLGREVWLLQVDTYLPPGKAYGYNDIGLLQFAVLNIAEELAAGRELDARIVPVVYDAFALFVAPEAAAALPQLMRELREQVRELLGLEVHARCAGMAEEPGELAACMDRLPEPGAGRGDIAGAAVALPRDQAEIRTVQNAIMSAIMLGEGDRLGADLERRVERLRALRPARAKREALALALALTGIMGKEFGLSREPAALAERLDALDALASAERVASWAAARAAEFLAAFRTWLHGQNRNIVEKAIQYIDRHYMERCDLKEVAGVVHLSPNYFSNLFKKETGESFVGYMTNVRIAKAKLAIAATELKVAEVARRVGYDDPNYFAKVFKQITGTTPREYRKAVQQRSEC